MPNFSHYNEYHYDIINQVLKTKGILLISLSKKTEKMAQLKYILSFDEFENDNYDPKKGGMPPENFVKCEDNIVFYNDSVDPPSKPKISKKEVRETITTVMKRLLRSQK